MTVVDNVKKAAYYKMVDYLFEKPQERFPKAMEMIDKAAPSNLFESQRAAFRGAIEQKNNWYQLLMKIGELNPEVRNRLVKTFLVDANLMAWNVQESNRDKYQCNIPWAILLDPTSACNLHCTGCWAAEYGHKLNLTYDDINSIIEHTCTSIRAESRSFASATLFAFAKRIPIAHSCASRTPRLSMKSSAKT